jgi:hypothetical protein
MDARNSLMLGLDAFAGLFWAQTWAGRTCGV